MTTNKIYRGNENMSKYKIRVSIDGRNFFWMIVENNRITSKNPTKEELNEAIVKYYNKMNICDRCREENNITDDSILYPKNAHHENDKDGNWTGRWNCPKCYEKYDPNSKSNIMKSLADRRTGNLIDDGNLIGDLTVDIVCELYDYEDLNYAYDNHNTPIDCRDKKTGSLHQVKGKRLVDGNWTFGHFEREWHKEYKDIICVCYNGNGSIIEELYKFPPEAIKGRSGVNIVKNPTDCVGDPIIPWYEKYRVKDHQREKELKKANNILKRKLKE